MMILLPPSEGKTPASGKKTLDFKDLAFPQLTTDREKVLKTLSKVSEQKNALEVLGVGKSIAPEVERNTHLADEPVAPAFKIYSGVLYDALDYSSLNKTAHDKAAQHVFVQSALFGLISLGDEIPAYRLSMNTKLSTLGILSTWWKKELTTKLADTLSTEDLFIDCRSGPYEKAMPTDPAKTVLIKPLEMVNGKKKVITHMAKQDRGLVTRELLQSTSYPKTPQEAADLLQGKWDTELTEPQGKNPWTLELVKKS